MMQKNVLTHEEIKEMIDNLYGTIGVRMNVDLGRNPDDGDSFVVSQSSFLSVAKIITDHLELPILIRPEFSEVFRTMGVVLNEGNVTLGIGAQVRIPGNLPWYNTSAMKNFPIDVIIPPKVLHQGRYYLMTMLSHEFSHIYLHSRRDPQKESEWATDLCALMMGFSPIWKVGRRQSGSSLGYLSADEFDFAVNYIYRLRRPFEKLRKSISSLKQDIQSDCDDISIYLEEIHSLYDFHFQHVQEVFRNMEDIAVFSKLAQPQYRLDIETLLRDSKRDVNAVLKLLQDKREFYEKDKKWMEDSLTLLDKTEKNLRQQLNELKHDHSVLVRNIDVKHYTSVFKTRIESTRKAICKANEKVQMIYRKNRILDKCLAHYGKYKKKSYAKGTDAKTFALIGSADYKVRLETFIKSKQERIDEIDDVIQKAREFYSIDDKILLSQITELNDMLSTLDYCLKEQEDYIGTVISNLNFIGRIKWMCGI